MLQSRAFLQGIWILSKKLTAILVNVDKLISEMNLQCLKAIKEERYKQMMVNLLELITARVKLN